MSLQIESLTPRREGTVVYIDLAGTLPSPAHEISAIRPAVTPDGAIIIAIDHHKRDGMFPQMIKRVRESVNIGRLGPGQYHVTVLGNGVTIHTAHLSV
jgi:hypothetical protein